MLNGSRVCLYLHGRKAGRDRRLGLQSSDTTSPLESSIIHGHNKSRRGPPSILPNIITLSRGVSLVPVPLRLQSTLGEERNRANAARGLHGTSTTSRIIGAAFGDSTRAPMGAPFSKALNS
jgi:hypothetical protein